MTTRKTDEEAASTAEMGSPKRKQKRRKAHKYAPSCRPENGIAHVVGVESELSTEEPYYRRKKTALDDDRQGNRKKKKKIRTCDDDAKNSVDSSVEDDMLFNFTVRSEALAVDGSDSLAVCRASVVKTGITSMGMLEKHEVVVKEEHARKKEKKKKKEKKRKKDEQEEQNSLQTAANGSVQEKKKLLIDEIPSEKQKLKNVKNEPKVLGLPDNVEKGQVPCMSDNNECPSGLSSRPTFSIAVAGSIINNAQSLQLATMLAGQIARAATIFRVDEIVVFDDYDGASASSYMQDENCEEGGGLFMVRILKYMEVPQYLRRALIPMHKSLMSVGKLPPLDAPHHLRMHEWRPFREGIILNKRPSSGSGSCVDVGLDKEVLVKQSLEPGTRVTVAMGQSKCDGDMMQVVDREAARQAGLYWGYTVRYASCLSAVFDECPFEGKYDFCIGTSEHGEKLRPTDLVIPKCKHLLVAFGGLSGLEESLELDKKLKKRSITNVFSRYLNTCPHQGSRTIRTEEAILISLQFLQGAAQEALCTPQT